MRSLRSRIPSASMPSRAPAFRLHVVVVVVAVVTVGRCTACDHTSLLHSCTPSPQPPGLHVVVVVTAVALRRAGGLQRAAGGRQRGDSGDGQPRHQRGVRHERPRRPQGAAGRPGWGAPGWGPAPVRAPPPHPVSITGRSCWAGRVYIFCAESGAGGDRLRI